MRIISGKYGRRRFATPGNLKLRPTTDLAKEALFNTLAARYDFEGAHVLDLFAGTGSIGLEFLSRGAERVVSVEQNARHAAFIKQLVQSLGEQEVMRVVKGDALAFLAGGGGGGEVYDFIFADPPYALPNLPSIPQAVQQSGLLRRGGLFILEHPAEYDFAAQPGFLFHKSYSAVQFTFFEF